MTSDPMKVFVCLFLTQIVGYLSGNHIFYEDSSYSFYLLQKVMKGCAW